MAYESEQRTGKSRWWLWLIALLILIGIAWSFFGRDDPDRAVVVPGPQPVVPVESATVVVSPAPAVDQASAPTPAASAAALGDLVTDIGVFASTADKLSLVGRQVALSSVQVARVIGPKTFAIAAGSEELVVMIDSSVDRGVGSQGQIDAGKTVNLKGSFQRLQQEQISDISDNRFRTLTDAEREALRQIQVYLQATEFSKIN